MSNDAGWIHALDEELNKVSHLGTRTFENGTRWIGHKPHEAPAAYVHRVFGPATQAEIDEVQESFPQPLPADLVTLYRHHSGLMILNGLIFIYGIANDRTLTGGVGLFDIRRFTWWMESVPVAVPPEAYVRLTHIEVIP